MDRKSLTDNFEFLSSQIPKELLVKLNFILDSLTCFHNEVETYKPDEILMFLEFIKENYTQCDLNRVEKVLVIGFLSKNLDELLSGLSIVEAKAYDEYLRRMKGSLFESSYSFPSLDVFWKELGVARLQLFPLTSGVAESFSGFGIKQGLTCNPIQMVKFTNILFNLGRKPYFRTHVHTPLLNNFNEDGWVESYLQIAERLKRNKQIKGLVRGGWFFDPKVKAISPRLSYLYDLPKSNGASFFRIEKDYTGNAIATSKTRRDLFEKGLYTPTNYLVIWPREKLIKWAETTNFNNVKFKL